MAIVASVLCLAMGRTASVSALLAGLSCIIPTFYVLVVSMRPVSPGTTGLALVLRGEAGKYALTVALLAVIFVWVRPLDVAVFFGTFVLMQGCQAIVHFQDAWRMMKKPLPPG